MMMVVMTMAMVMVMMMMMFFTSQSRIDLAMSKLAASSCASGCS